MVSKQGADATPFDPGLAAVLTRRGAVRALGLLALGALAGCGSRLANAPEAAATSDATTVADASGSADATTAAVSPRSAGSAAPTTAAAQADPVSPVDAMLGRMTIEHKVAQLFFVTPEGLTGVGQATRAASLTARALEEIPVGGLVYFSKNIAGADQLRSLLADSVELSRAAGAGVAAFTGVDEEGGSLVARVANSGHFDVRKFPNMASIGAAGDASRARDVGSTIGSYLRDIGFTVGFAPDADVLTNPHNTAIGARSFGSDPAIVSSMVAAEVAAMLETGMLPCAKHFPGHGDTAADSHTGEAVSERSLEQLEACEYKPFRAAIGAGVPFVMVGHIKTPNAAADGLPASLSPVMIRQTLREELGFGGVIVSDSFSMGAITQYYDSAAAAVRFLEAGGDMVLMPEDLRQAYDGVLAAVSSGELEEARIDESVRRVLVAKQHAGLLA